MAKKKKNVYKKQQLVDLLTGLQDVQNLKGVELAVCSQKNTELIDNLLSDIEVKARPPKDFVDLATEMQQFNMETEIEKVKAKEQEPENAKIIQERREQLDEIANLLQEDIECKLFKISIKDLPVDITGKQIGLINLIVT
jgi:hypothetical protein